MKVLVVIITANTVEEECLLSIIEQTYSNYSWVISGRKPIHKTDDVLSDLYRNCTENRNAARQMALASDADAFLFVDSDIVLPVHAIDEFVLQHRPKPFKGRLPTGMVHVETSKNIIGGWYKIHNSPAWVAGMWVDDNVFAHHYFPENSLINVDTIGMGCAFMTREVLEQIEFEHGTDILCKNPHGSDLRLGECGIFGNRAAEKGFLMYMDGSVICKHIKYVDGKKIYA